MLSFVLPKMSCLLCNILDYGKYTPFTWAFFDDMGAFFGLITGNTLEVFFLRFAGAQEQVA